MLCYDFRDRNHVFLFPELNWSIHNTYSYLGFCAVPPLEELLPDLLHGLLGSRLGNAFEWIDVQGDLVLLQLLPRLLSRLGQLLFVDRLVVAPQWASPLCSCLTSLWRTMVQRVVTSAC